MEDSVHDVHRIFQAGSHVFRFDKFASYLPNDDEQYLQINKGNVATFIDDVLVGTETEEGHDELVEEILKRLEEHDLYIKPEKCEWRVREVGFLGVVIGPDGIKMEKEKVRGMLE